jgi:hypothetical protein
MALLQLLAYGAQDFILSSNYYDSRYNNDINININKFINYYLNNNNDLICDDIIKKILKYKLIYLINNKLNKKNFIYYSIIEIDLIIEKYKLNTEKIDMIKLYLEKEIKNLCNYNYIKSKFSLTTFNLIYIYDDINKKYELIKIDKQ